MSVLTARQQAFVSEYLVDLNAARAAVRAGYSQKSAGKYGPQLLLNPAVAGEVRQAMAEREGRIKITQDHVVEELARVAFGDLRELADWGPEGLRLKASGKLTVAQAALVCEVAEGSGRGASGAGVLRIKRHDKLKALELLGKHLGMFKENRPHTREDGGIIREFMKALQESAAPGKRNGGKRPGSRMADSVESMPRRAGPQPSGQARQEEPEPDEKRIPQDEPDEESYAGVAL